MADICTKPLYKATEVGKGSYWLVDVCGEMKACCWGVVNSMGACYIVTFVSNHLSSNLIGGISVCKPAQDVHISVQLFSFSLSLPCVLLWVFKQSVLST